jgi:hypothetical protein
MEAEQRKIRITQLLKEKEQIEKELDQLIEGCEHNIVRVPFGTKNRYAKAVCEICGTNFGDWCPNSPTHTHVTEIDEYEDEVCIHCGENFDEK